MTDSTKKDSWEQLTAKDMMQSGMVTVSLEATASEIECVLVENKVSGVPVRDGGDKIVGLVSWRDVMGYFAENSHNEPHNPHAFYRFVDSETLELGSEIEIPIDETVTARDVMSTELLTTAANSSLRSVAMLMTEHGVHRVLVTNPFDEVIGILSTMDILRSLSS